MSQSDVSHLRREIVMQFWKRVLAGSLGVLGLAASGQAQTGSGGIRIEEGSVTAAARRPAHPMQPDTYGTSGVSYYNIDAMELVPTSSGTAYTESNNNIFSTNHIGMNFNAGLHLPSGAMIVTLELDFYDNSAAGEVEAALFACDYHGTNCSRPIAADCIYSEATACSGVPDTAGDSYRIVDLTYANLTVNNYYNRYFVWAGSTTTDGETGVSRISIGYKLQVSPGPTAATFTDVPTSHPFFNFVEALHAAGITSGYPDGRFGVDDPITRGQMAVFLSTALGLNWP